MQRFISFLIENPLLLILILGPLVSLIGKSIKGAAEKAQRKEKSSRPASGPQQGPTAQRPRPPRSSSQAPTGGPTSPMAGPPAGRQGPSPEEVAAEMRRILGMDPPKKPAKPAPAPPPRQAAPPVVRRVAAPLPRSLPSQSAQPQRPPAPSVVAEERAFEAAVARDRSTSVFDRLRTRIDPTVGERIQDRQGPMSGAVGQTALGGLGGRTTTRAVRGPMRGSRLVDVRDMARAIVMREILDPPVGMRDLR